jgi:hypothetical protein
MASSTDQDNPACLASEFDSNSVSDKLRVDPTNLDKDSKTLTGSVMI